MTSRSKERVAAAFRKFFSRSRKLASPDMDGAAVAAASGTESPAKRLMRHSVQPVEATAPNAAEIRKSTRTRSESSAHQTKVRSRRLMKELKDLQKLELDPNYNLPFTVELVNDNLFEWQVRLHRVDPDSLLAADMRDNGIPWILLNVSFPELYPFQPPFMRVVSPNIEKGYVMQGGAICMELLTPSGWASAYTIEAVIMQFAASVVKGQGRIIKSSKGRKVFSQRSAEESFRSVVKTHAKYGWVTPPLADG